tara:strand:- start:519 stop:698 length:180 start_codon:yes stop_codon:yes gene_type:complete
MNLDPDAIEISNLNKSFEYIKIAREIDTLEQIENVKRVAKCYAKLYLKTQETVASLGNL